MRRVAMSLGVGLVAGLVALLPLPATSSHADDKIGGYDVSGFAAPVSMLVYEPAIPVPVEPQGELHYSFTQAIEATGPFSTGVASSVYPGATLATGLQQFKPDGVPPPFDKFLTPPNYPIYTSADYPSSQTHSEYPKNAKPSQTGFGMIADASEAKTYGKTLTGAPPPQATGLIDFTNASSTSTVTQSASKVGADVVAQVDGLSLFAGIIKVGSVVATSSATSDAAKGGAAGNITVGGVTVAGVPFSVDDKGTHVGPAQLPKIPGIPATGAALLSQLGISFSVPTSVSTVAGTKGENSTSGLAIQIDLAPFKAALAKTPIRVLLSRVVPKGVCLPSQLDALGGQLPFGSCLDENVDALLNLSPRIVYLVGNTFATANANPPYLVDTSLPGDTGFNPTTTTTAGTPGTPGTPGTSGTPGIPGTGTEQPTVAAPATTTGGLLPAGYAGLGGAGLLGALVALVTWYAVRNLGLGVVAGLAGCEYGAPRSVPDLRRG